jgi:hypothetical protein
MYGTCYTALRVFAFDYFSSYFNSHFTPVFKLGVDKTGSRRHIKVPIKHITIRLYVVCVRLYYVYIKKSICRRDKIISRRTNMNYHSLA